MHSQSSVYPFQQGAKARDYIKDISCCKLGNNGNPSVKQTISSFAPLKSTDL